MNVHVNLLITVLLAELFVVFSSGNWAHIKHMAFLFSLSSFLLSLFPISSYFLFFPLLHLLSSSPFFSGMFTLPQFLVFIWWLSGKESTSQSRRHRFDPWVRKIPWRRKIAAHSSILAWEVPWTDKPDELQSIGSQKSWTQLSN